MTASRARTVEELRVALEKAKSATETVLIEIETDALVPAPSSESWWDVAVAEVSDLESATRARRSYEAGKAQQQRYL